MNKGKNLRHWLFVGNRGNEFSECRVACPVTFFHSVIGKSSIVVFNVGVAEITDRNSYVV